MYCLILSIHLIKSDSTTKLGIITLNLQRVSRYKFLNMVLVSIKLVPNSQCLFYCGCVFFVFVLLLVFFINDGWVFLWFGFCFCFSGGFLY